MSDAIGWGFALMALEGWTLDEVASNPPAWLCAECTDKADQAEFSSGSRTASNGGETTGRSRVLVIDDEHMVLRATARALSDFHVRRATSAEEALALLEIDSNYDAIVSDVSMPNVTGAELFRAVSTRWPDLARCFLFVSGNVFKARPLIALAAQRSGVFPTPVLLGKPIDPVELRDEVLMAIARRAPQSGAYPILAASDAARRKSG